MTATSTVPTPQYCGAERRRQLVREAVDGAGQPFLNGIDYLEVSPSDQRELTVTFLHPLPGEAGGVPSGPALTRDTFLVTGGVRVRDIVVESLVSTTDDRVVLRTDRAGDYSLYEVHLVRSAEVTDAPDGFDPALAAVPFSFKVDCDNGEDCAPGTAAAEPAPSAPPFSYLARDYTSFRRLILDRLAQTVPDWSERSPADIGIVVAELLAYLADHVSYQQDSVATEAYLGTARRRASVRRHSRLVDYAMHDGANARAWLVFDTDADRGNAVSSAVPAGTAVGVPADPGGRPSPATVVFETLHDLPLLLVTRNTIGFHTWGDADCGLPAGTTAATLAGAPGEFGLAAGDVLVLEEVLGPDTGRPEDADPAHRHAVRLAADPVAAVDPLTGTAVTGVRWFDDDALPFSLSMRLFDDGTGGTRAAGVVRGNVALADHGISQVSAHPGADLVPALVPADGPYRPLFLPARLTQAVRYEGADARNRPARAAIDVDPAAALPALRLRGDGETWLPLRDLLGSDRFTTCIVVEPEDDGRARLRFGDGILGRSPSAGSSFVARYRVGGGPEGNVGAEALTELLRPLDGVRVRNPLPAAGGLPAEPIRTVKLTAPQAFRTQQRAVTPADYAAAAQRFPEVSRAAATRRWTGSWYTVFVTVDRTGGRPVDANFEQRLRDFLEPFRMAGNDLEVDAPRFVPLEVALTICAQPQHEPAAVRQAVTRALSVAADPEGDGVPGFFHPDGLTFGQPVYLSQLLSRVAGVPGVQRIVSVDAFHRYGQLPEGEIEQGYVPIHRLEIARLDNDPSLAERGRLTVTVSGGMQR